MKHIAALLVCIVCVTSALAGGTLDQARKEWLEGNYAEARDLYQMLAKNAKTRLPATLGLSKALESQGEYDKAQKAIEALLIDMPKDADLLARLAELHHTRGRFEEAEKAAQAALAEKKDHFLAHWVLGQSYRDRGEDAKAEEQFVWFVRVYDPDKTTDPNHLRLVGLAQWERARIKHLTEEFQVILGVFSNAAKNDKLYWQGHFEAGRLFLEKHNKPEAFKRFEKAMTINPLAAEVLVCKGQMAAAGMEFKDAEKYGTLALKVNPRYVPALCLMADIHWFSGEMDATLKKLAKAREVNPRDEAVLARLAACAFAQKKDDEVTALAKEAQKNNPKCYTFYNDLASLLEQRKFNDEAEKYYNIAIKMQPKFPEAQAGLGMLYMRTAKEADARKTLENAEAADKFDVRVFNSLKVLDHLDKYDTLKTEHFILRFDKENDTVLANFMAIYLENIYKDLADQFDYRPRGPFQIQIFKKHEMFSGRVVAVPDLHTIGACTGPLVAMVSPRDMSKVTQLFNWNRVIRHELVHVFNLQQTKGKVPHWFTEGLAVRYEGSNIPPSWHGLLADKVKANDLLDLDNILLGFIRPRSPLQWQQAYLQSLLYVEYLTKTHGEKSIGKMLSAFEDGLDTGPALERACNVKKADFEKGYRDFLVERVKNTPAPVGRPEMTLTQARAAHKKNPGDDDLSAQLAEMEYFKGKRTVAKELSEKVLAKSPKHPTAAYVRALLMIDEKRPADAYELLESVVTDDLKETKPLKLLLKLQYQVKKDQEAIRTCERARKIDPHDTYWVKQLVDLYVKTGENDKKIEIFEDVVKLDPDAISPRRTLASYYLKMGKNAEAEKFARMGLEIDVKDAECQRVILEALAALNRQEDADRLRRIFGL